MPTVTVEIGFDNGGNRQSLGTTYSSLAWTDVTAYVLAKTGVKFNRGRAETGMAAAAGQLVVTFDNSDGRFTPGTTGGAYGRVRTRMPIRVKGGSTVMWVGFITDIDWQMRSGQPEVTMVAADIVGAAARTKCGPYLTKRILAYDTGLINYWPLTDTAPNSVVSNTNTAVAALVGDRARAAYGANVLTVAGDSNAGLSFNVTSDVSPDPAAEPVFEFTPVPITGSGKYLTSTATLDATGDLAVAMWVKPTSTVSVTLLAVKYTGTGVNTFALHTQSDGTLRVAADYASGASVTFGSLTDDVWSHLYLERDNSATAPASRFRLWVNGTERTGTATSTMTSDTNTGLDVSIGGDSVMAINAFDGLMSHVALWNTITGSSAGRVAFLADKGGGGDTPCSTRFAELHYLTPNPVGLSSWIDSTTQADNTVSPQASNGKSLLQLAEEVADAERGSVIATREGKLRLLAQRYFIAPAAVSVTLSAETDILSLANTFGVDDTSAINECVVTLQPSGWRYTAARVLDPGVESTTVEVWSADQYFAMALAAQIANATTEQPRAPSLTLSMEWLARAGLDDEIRGLELGDSIQVTDLPAQAPAASLTLQVRLIEHNITAAGWTVRIDTDPPIYGAVLDDGTRGILDGTTYLGV